MTSPEYSGPFAGAPWNEENWHKFASTWAPSGVLGAIAPSATSGVCAFSNSGLAVSVGAGNLWVHGAGYELPGKSRTAAPNTNSTFSRRDRLVARYDLAADVVNVVWLQGTPAQTAVAPALTRTASQWDMPLFSFLVPPASGTTLTSIIDERPWLDPNGAGVLSFFGTAGRDAYFPGTSAADGAIVWLASSSSHWVRSGGAWQNVALGDTLWNDFDVPGPLTNGGTGCAWRVKNGYCTVLVDAKYASGSGAWNVGYTFATGLPKPGRPMWFDGLFYGGGTAAGGFKVDDTGKLTLAVNNGSAGGILGTIVYPVA